MTDESRTSSSENLAGSVSSSGSKAQKFVDKQSSSSGGVALF